MTEARLELDDYTARVLDVIKGKFGLKNRSEALKKFAQEQGDNYLEHLPNPKVLRDLDRTYEEHIKKHGRRRMTKKELRKLLCSMYGFKTPKKLEKYNKEAYDKFSQMFGEDIWG